MSLTYKIASTIVRLIGVKKMFLKNKEEMLEYAKGENAKIVFDLEKAKKFTFSVILETMELHTNATEKITK